MWHRLQDLASKVGATVRGDAERRVRGIATLESAGADDLSFLTNLKYRRQALASAAGALLVGPALAGLERDLIVADDPYYALAQLLEELHPEPRPEPGIDPRAAIDGSARVDPGATVGAFAVIGARTEVGAGAVVYPHAVIGADCRVGDGTEIHPQVVLYDGTRVGRRCILHAGVVLGSDGFGYATHQGAHHKLRQLGRVVVEDDVEIGANCTVDRAMLEETRIGAGSKFDNLVHLGHNAVVGRRCLLVAQVGISGSSRLGDDVIVGGQTGVAGHLAIGDRVQVGSKSAVFKTVPEGERVAGIPATRMTEWRRQQAVAARLPEMHRRLRRLEGRLEALEKEGER